MSTLVLALSAVIVVLMAASLYRLVRGPSVFDRMVAVGIMGTKALLLLTLIGFLFERTGAFVDLALVYGLLNFAGAIAVAKYLERQREGPS